MRRRLEALAGRLRLSVAHVTIGQLGAGVALIGPAAMMLAGYGWPGAIVVLASGLSAAILSRIEDLAELGAFGFTAKLREARRLVRQAEVTAEELRNLTLPMLRMSLGIAMGGGRFGSYGTVRSTTLEMAEQALAAIDATKEERLEAFTEWRAWEHIDAALEVAKGIREEWSRRRPVEAPQAPKPSDLHDALIDIDTLRVAPAGSFRTVAERFHAFTPEVENRIEILRIMAERDNRPDKHKGMPRSFDA